MTGFIPFFCVLTGTASLTLLLKRSFGRVLPFYLITAVLTVFFSAVLFRSFLPGVVIVLLFSAALLPLFFISGKKKDAAEPSPAKLLLTGGALSFVLFSVFFILQNRNYSFWNWDEFSHWGPMVKEMLRLDVWYCAEGSRLMVHGEYPPFTALFQLFWCRLSGGYSESGMLTSLQLLSLSVMLPPLLDLLQAESRKRKLIRSLAVSAAIFPIINFFDLSRIFCSCYTDYFAAFLWVGGLILLICGNPLEDGFDFTSFILLNSALLLTKQIGIAYWLLLLLAFLLTALLRRKQLKPFHLLHAAALLPSLCWKAVSAGSSVGAQFSFSRISVSELLNLLKGESHDLLRSETLRRYLEALSSRTLIYFRHFSISFLEAFIAAAALMLLLFFLLKKEERRSLLLPAAEIFAGTAGFVLLMGVLYLFCFSEAEMLQLASFERYFYPFVTGETLMLAVFVLDKISRRRAPLLQLALLAAAAVTLLNPTLKEMFRYSAADTSLARATAAFLDEKLPEGASVFLLSEDGTESQYYVNYYTEKVFLTPVRYPLLQADLNSPENLRIASEYLRCSDYLYLKDVPADKNSFLENELRTEVHPGGLYRIGVKAELIAVFQQG